MKVTVLTNFLVIGIWGPLKLIPTQFFIWFLYFCSFYENHQNYDFILLKNIFHSFLKLWKNIQKYILKN